MIGCLLYYLSNWILAEASKRFRKRRDFGRFILNHIIPKKIWARIQAQGGNNLQQVREPFNGPKRGAGIS